MTYFSDNRYPANAENSPNPYAANRLMELMSEISEDLYCAGWLSGLEDSLWHIAQGGPREYGMGEVTAEKIEELKRLSAACGGWIAWGDGADGETWLPMSEWLASYDADHMDRIRYEIGVPGARASEAE